jgi:predicted RNA-binding Zn-ribbon protein involved in translation (DUF1610 family)
MSTLNIVQCHPESLIFIQSRADINFSVVNEYAEMMGDGVEFDPVSAVREKDQIYVWDGYHRGEAAKKADTKLAVNVQPGTKQDAEWLALSANQKHGLRRTKADEERIARNALLKFSDRSVREIQRHTGINRRKISRIRDDLVASGAIAPDNKVTVSRGGVTYQQDTSNIGSKQPSRYVPIWELETAIHKWLANTFPERAAQIQVLEGIKQDTPRERQYLEQLLTDDILPSPRRKRDVIQACNNVLEQYRQIKRNDTSADEQSEHRPKAQEFQCPRCGQEKIVGVNGSRRWCLSCEAQWSTAAEFLAEFRQRQEEPEPQEVGSQFQSRQPTAGDQTIVPTQATIRSLSPSKVEAPRVVTRQRIQDRFLDILARLEERDEQLIQIEIWLDDLERNLVFLENNEAAELITWSMPIQTVESA